MSPHVSDKVRLAPYTSLGLGGPAGRLLEPDTADDVVAAVAEADRAGERVLILGGGSNVVIPDEGFAGTVIRVATRGIELTPAGGRVMLLRAQAGEDWDPLVARCVHGELVGVESLSGIPGLVGATPIQNVGAYGQEVRETVAVVRAYDRMEREVVELGPAGCRFGYRTSAFKGTDRYVVLDVTFALERGMRSAPVRYAQLARELGVQVGDRVPLADARSAVLRLRRRKSMVLDPADGDTASAGSFFTNPVLTDAQLAALEERAGADAGIPRFPAGEGRTKVSAAWLIEHAGFARGYGRGGVRVSTKHTLALTNPRGEGTTCELVALAREIRDGVRARFGVELANEPRLVDARL